MLESRLVDVEILRVTAEVKLLVVWYFQVAPAVKSIYFSASGVGELLFVHEIPRLKSARKAKMGLFMGKIVDLLVNIGILLINIKYIFLSLRSQNYG